MNEKVHMCGAEEARDYRGTEQVIGRTSLYLLVHREFRDLRFDNVKIWSDYIAAFEAVNNPIKWPRYRNFVSRIKHALSD
ncbi:unnamed protein product [Arabidopsis lyrata]|nr:unnamed protein product [Arabidopsis lyrata]